MKRTCADLTSGCSLLGLERLPQMLSSRVLTGHVQYRTESRRLHIITQDEDRKSVVADGGVSSD